MIWRVFKASKKVDEEVKEAKYVLEAQPWRWMVSV